MCGLKLNQKLHFKIFYIPHSPTLTVLSASGNLNRYVECLKALSCFSTHENPDQLKGFRKYFTVKLFTICITKSENIYDAVLIAKA